MLTCLMSSVGRPWSACNERKKKQKKVVNAVHREKDLFDTTRKYGATPFWAFQMFHPIDHETVSSLGKPKHPAHTAPTTPGDGQAIHSPYIHPHGPPQDAMAAGEGRLLGQRRRRLSRKKGVGQDPSRESRPALWGRGFGGRARYTRFVRQCFVCERKRRAAFLLRKGANCV